MATGERLHGQQEGHKGPAEHACCEHAPAHCMVHTLAGSLMLACWASEEQSAGPVIVFKCSCNRMHMPLATAPRAGVRRTLRVFSNWLLMRVIMPSAAMNDSRLRTYEEAGRRQGQPQTNVEASEDHAGLQHTCRQLTTRKYATKCQPKALQQVHLFAAGSETTRAQSPCCCAPAVRRPKPNAAACASPV
eukprot:GHRQ01024898.1.p1 GENE.GHRQ01024898.1~~GHRQ01024898.1.p1  ORF type:complete len:190 (+),score=16.96 GHRQ01024898.1:108-677(+)